MNNVKSVRLVGDLHGNVARFPRQTIESHCSERNYFKIIRDCEYSICIGDIGFESDLDAIKILNTDYHKILLGNHSDHDKGQLLPNYLGRFGSSSLNGMYFFFVDGAFSIDHMYRDKSGIYQSWWENEELSQDEMCECLKKYEELKPQIVISHDCPQFLIGPMLKSSFRVDTPSRTSRFFEIMWGVHKPKYWYFGHHHQNKVYNIDVTTFVCISELCYVDVNLDGSIISGPN